LKEAEGVVSTASFEDWRGVQIHFNLARGSGGCGGIIRGGGVSCWLCGIVSYVHFVVGFNRYVLRYWWVRR